MVLQRGHLRLRPFDPRLLPGSYITGFSKFLPDLVQLLLRVSPLDVQQNGIQILNIAVSFLQLALLFMDGSVSFAVLLEIVLSISGWRQLWAERYGYRLVGVVIDYLGCLRSLFYIVEICSDQFAVKPVFLGIPGSQKVLLKTLLLKLCLVQSGFYSSLKRNRLLLHHVAACPVREVILRSAAEIRKNFFLKA